MAPNASKLWPIFLPYEKPAPRQPAPPLPNELLHEILELAMADAEEDDECVNPAWECQLVRVRFSAVCRSWYALERADENRVVLGPRRASLLARSLQRDKAKAAIIRTLHLQLEDPCDSDGEEVDDPEWPLEQSQAFAELVDVCPRLKELAVSTDPWEGGPLGLPLIASLKKRRLEVFEVDYDHHDLTEGILYG